MTHKRPRLTALAGATLVTVIVAGCTPSAAEPVPRMISNKPPTDTSSTSTPRSADNPAAPAQQAEAKAYAAAEKIYRAWVVNYAIAEAAGFDPKKLDNRLATPALIKALTKQFKQFRTKGGTGKYTQDIRWMKGNRYLKGETATFRLCAVTNSRFLQDGKDVTITSDGAPAPVQTQPQQRYVSVESIDDGKTWKSSTILYSSDEKEASC